MDNLEKEVLNLEKNISDNNILRNILGQVHSIKGSAGSFGLKSLTNIYHQLEDHFMIDHDPTNELMDISLKVIDVSREYVKSFTSDKHDELIFHEKFLEVFRKKRSHFKGRFLLNESDPFMIKLITSTLEEMEIGAALSNDGYEALGRILNEDFDGLITSYLTPTIDGINLTKIIRATDLISSDFKIIFITSDDDVDEFDGVNKLFRKRSTLRDNIKDYLDLIYAE